MLQISCTTPHSALCTAQNNGPFRNDVKNKNGGNSLGTLYGKPMERLAFRYDRHEEIVRYFGCGMYTIIQW